MYRINLKIPLILTIMLLNVFIATAQTLDGVWYYKKNNTLTISNTTNSSFHFVFRCNRDNDVKELTGDALIKGKIAEFEDSEKCPIKFEFTNKTIIVKVMKYNGDDYSSYDSERCKLIYGNYYEGKYLKKTSIAKTNKTVSEFEQFLGEFKTAVISKDKQKIVSLINFPYFRYDLTSQTSEKYSVDDFFKIDKENFYFGPGTYLIDTKDKDRAKFLKSKSIMNFSTNDEAFYKAVPSLRHEIPAEVSLNNKSYGLQSYLFLKVGNQFKLIGEIVLTNDSTE